MLNFYPERQHSQDAFFCDFINMADSLRRRGRQKKRWEYKIKEWTGMGFGDSLRAAEDREGRMERYCCNDICGAPKTSAVKRLRDERLTPSGLNSFLTSRNESSAV